MTKEQLIAAHNTATNWGRGGDTNNWNLYETVSPAALAAEVARRQAWGA